MSIGSSVNAFTIETDTPGLKMTWDNTIKYSNAFRVKGQNPVLLGNPNADDGNRNFNKGVISNRLDILSEFDVQYEDMGARISGAAWYDSVYNRSNDNPGFAGGAFPNNSSRPYNNFTERTRDLHGQKAELLDAFVFTRFDLGDSRALVRLGQHGMVWGESLFYGGNAIAGGMAPVDVTKLISVPGTQFKEAIRPVPQVSGQIQLTPNLALGAYYQFRYQSNRLPAVGSYFSQVDTNVDGGEQILLGPLGAAPRQADLLPKDSGQGGVQLRFRHADTDYGLYAIRFHDKSPQLVTNLINLTPGGAPTLVPGSYYVTYQQKITAMGVSASRTFGPANIAVEASIRNNQDLASAGHAVDVSRAFGSPATNNTNNPSYAVGRTAHVNVSMLWSMDPTVLFREANVAAELAWNRVLSCKTNCSVFDPQTRQGVIDNNATRDAVALRILFEPKYRQALPGLDLSVPISIGFAPHGSRSMALGSGAFPADGGGDLTIGVNGNYLDAWQFSLAYTHYYGGAKTFLDSNNSFSYGQSLKDRDFVAFSLRRTF
ncbi:DUF1302 domain-containing protein [Noviherbaspirillum sedimenti]|uniref:DUF1302 domain-containing protein n=2 Tax=Noviherbaspirillum sedimenti TaxID=2320865 RepID=A0A3A3GA26_9BURK|nr:DUF1302 domain-containing protein [Noviherbaspirillum sedimenti]